jgi:hypothetical protein
MSVAIFLLGFFVSLPLIASPVWAADPAPIFADQGTNWNDTKRAAVRTRGLG